MFSKVNKRAGSSPVIAGLPAKTNGGGVLVVPSIISADMTIVGDLRSNGDVHVDGNVQGDIAVRHLTVGEAASVRGEVSADSVRVCGSVNGRIRAREVVLTATARMHGDVHHETLSIEAGAQLDGQCRRLGEPATAGREVREAKEVIAPGKATIESTRLTLEPVPGTH
jgi:cytoskeletal protein CcmA (bactofilin family)